MHEDGLILSSITYAMRGQEILARYGIRGYVQRLPGTITGCGCGYGLRVTSDFEKAEQIIIQSGIQVKGTYDSHDIS